MLLPEEAKAMGTPPGLDRLYPCQGCRRGDRKALKKAGGAVHREPADIPEVGRFSVVADPQGAMFMLMHAERPGPAARRRR